MSPFCEMCQKCRNFPRGTKFREFSEKPIGISKSRNLCFSCTPTSTLDEQKCTLFSSTSISFYKRYISLERYALLPARIHRLPKSVIFVKNVERVKTFEIVVDTLFEKIKIFNQRHQHFKKLLNIAEVINVDTKHFTLYVLRRASY